MKKSLLIALLCIMHAARTLAQTSVTIGGAMNVTDSGALFLPYVHDNMDTTITTTVWIKLPSPITDSIGATTTFPRNFSFNFPHNGLICNSNQTYTAGFSNSSGTYHADTMSVTLLPCTGIMEHFIPASAITIMPMPVTESSVLSIDGQHDGIIVVYDALGKTVNTMRYNDGQAVIRREDFVPGMYLAIGYDGNGIAVGRQKFIVE